MRSAFLLFIVLATALVLPVRAGTVATDNSFGPARSLSGPNFAVTAAFGFLGKHPEGVAVVGSLLRVPSGHAITIAAGPLQLTNAATLRAPAGDIDVLSLASPSTALLVRGDAPAAPSSALFADVSLI